MKKFGDEKSPTILVLELSRVRMNAKEKIKHFNQRFLTLLNNILEYSRPQTNVLLEFYTTVLPSSIAIFIKRVAKNSLDKTMEETLEM